MKKYNNKKKEIVNKKSFINKHSLALIALTILLLYGVWLNYTNKEENKINFSPDVSIKFTRKLYLTDEQESYNFNKDLKIEFVSKGQENSDDGVIYKYKANIYLKDKKVLTIDNDNIYSKNAAAYFEIIQSNNVYIFNSFVARQCNSSKIMIMTSDGKKLEINESALDFDISKDLKSFTLTTCDSCMSDNCQIKNYKIEKKNIVKSK